MIVNIHTYVEINFDNFKFGPITNYVDRIFDTSSPSLKSLLWIEWPLIWIFNTICRRQQDLRILCILANVQMLHFERLDFNIVFSVSLKYIALEQLYSTVVANWIPIISTLRCASFLAFSLFVGSKQKNLNFLTSDTKVDKPYSEMWPKCKGIKFDNFLASWCFKILSVFSLSDSKYRFRE